LFSNRTKHIKAKFFLIKDYYKAEEIDVQCCPTDVMWADVLTKHYNDRSSETCVHFYKTVQEIMMMTLNYKPTNWFKKSKCS
jgi:hypothetical protein